MKCAIVFVALSLGLITFIGAAPVDNGTTGKIWCICSFFFKSYTVE